MIPMFGFENMKFTASEGKYIGIVNFTHNKGQNGLAGVNHLTGNVKVNELEYPVDLTFRCNASLNLRNLTTPLIVRINGKNNLDGKTFLLTVHLKIGIGTKCKIEGNYGSRMISESADFGFNSIVKVFETIISFAI